MIKVKLKFIRPQKRDFTVMELKDQAEKLKRTISARFYTISDVEIHKKVIEIKNLRKPDGLRENYLTKVQRDIITSWLEAHYKTLENLHSKVWEE